VRKFPIFMNGKRPGRGNDVSIITACYEEKPMTAFRTDFRSGHCDITCGEILGQSPGT
jgi:hypothetical protein